jgi:hypothetical protein
MTLRPFSNGMIEALNRFSKNVQLRNQCLRHEGIGHHDPFISGQRHGTLDGGQALMDALPIAHVVPMKEAFQGATLGELGGFEGWPLTEKVTKQPGVLMGKPLEHVREIRLQRPGESIGDPDPILHEATPVFHQVGQGTHLGTLGHERLELIPVSKSQCKLKLGIGGIVLGPTRGKGLAIFRQHHRINVKEHQAIIFA